MTRIKLILNPAAGRGHAAELAPELKNIVADEIAATSANGQTYHTDWVHTSEPLHATELAAKAAEEGYDIVVAIGGDGTVHEVINGLMQIPFERRPQLGVIPIGTGNDFAFNIGLPENPREAARCIIGDTFRTVDVGSISDNNGRNRYWNNTIGVGFNGAVSILSRKYTRLRGFIVYLLSVLETILFKPQALNTSILVDNEIEMQVPLTMFSICNGPREGGGFPVSPNAIMDDGLISYTIMRKMNRLNMLRFLPVVMMAKHLNYTRFFQEGTAKSLSISSDKTMAIHTDGELFGLWEDEVRQLQVSIIPAALNVLTNCS